MENVPDIEGHQEYERLLKEGWSETVCDDCTADWQKPDYFRTGLFGTGVPHRFSFIKTERDIYLEITTPDKTQFCHWHNADFPPITEGRIGLRHMFTRAARYRDIRISTRS